VGEEFIDLSGTISTNWDLCMRRVLFFLLGILTRKVQLLPKSSGEKSKIRQRELKSGAVA